jgi:hypothetical protein
MQTNPTRVNPAKRIGYAFAGLIAGDAILLLLFLLNTLLVRAALLRAHAGEPAHIVSQYLQIFVLYAVFSFVGWLFVGVPASLLFPARSITRLSWVLALLVGAALGPLALLAIILLINHGRISFPSSFTGAGLAWTYSILVSTTSFLVYVALLRRDVGRQALP